MPTLNCRILKSVSISRMYDPRPRRIWDGIQCQRSHNGQIVHYRIDYLLHIACNSSRGKGTGVGEPPQQIGNSEPPTPLLRYHTMCLIARTTRCTSHNLSFHHQLPVPCPEPIYRTSDVSAAGATPKDSITQQIPTGRPPTCPVHPLP